MHQADLIPRSAAVMPKNLDNPVVDHIRSAIEAQGGGITYETFMDLSMYSRGALPPEGVQGHGDGYYASGFAEVGGGDGAQDFVTHTTTPAFGMSMAHYQYNAWLKIGAPASFMVVEQGAGNGAQAKAFLDETNRQADLSARDDSASFRVFKDALQYNILEYSGGMIARQQERLAGYGVLWVYGSAIELPIGPTLPKGQDSLPLFFHSNELPDTFPAARVVKEKPGYQGSLKEVYVCMDENGALYEALGPLSSEELIYQANKADGRRPMTPGTERVFNLRALQWAGRMATALKHRKGGVVFTDYGVPIDVMDMPPRMYHRSVQTPYATLEGERRVYRLQYERPGEVDITTSIAFGALDTVLRQHGLEPQHALPEPTFLHKYGFDQHVEYLAEQEMANPDPKLWAEYNAEFPDIPDGYRLYVEERIKATISGRRPRSFLAYSYLKK